MVSACILLLKARLTSLPRIGEVFYDKRISSSKRGPKCVCSATSYCHPNSMPQNYLLGAYYYAWYSNPTGNYSRRGGNWTNPINSQSYATLQPELGFYDSGDPSIISQHVSWMQKSHIDFAAVSWVPPAFENFIDANVKKFAESGFPFLILMEPSPYSTPANWQKGLDQIYQDYVSEFPNFVKDASGLPTIVVFHYTLPALLQDKRFRFIYVQSPNPPGSMRFEMLNPGFDDCYLGRPTCKSYPHSMQNFVAGSRSVGTPYDNIGFDQATSGKFNPVIIGTFNEWFELSPIQPCNLGYVNPDGATYRSWGHEYLDWLAANADHQQSHNFH